MTKSTVLRQQFLDTLGHGLTRYGFPAKVAPRTYNFRLATPCGHVGIFVNPIRHGEEIQFSLSCGISITYVQDRLTKTELYAQDYTGLTWTCGLMLDNLVRYKEWIAPPGPARKALMAIGIQPKEGAFPGYADSYMPVTCDKATLQRHVDRLIVQVDSCCWPFLLQYGFSEANFLGLCERNDAFVDVCFSGLEKQIVAGLILARKLGRADTERAIRRIGERKGAYYATHGNPMPCERIQRIVKQLNLN